MHTTWEPYGYISEHLMQTRGVYVSLSDQVELRTTRTDMKGSGLLLLLTLTRLWSGCVCLPATCSIHYLSYFGTSIVHCYNTNLTVIPDDIPANADSFTLSSSCSITNVSYLPPLPRLRVLELKRNCIDSFSWISLRALPNLKSLGLMGNRLRYVKLDTVIEHLPKLRDVDLRYNKLASFSEYELGRPQVTEAWLNGNPLRCDCDLSWLMVKMTCLQELYCTTTVEDTVFGNLNIQYIQNRTLHELLVSKNLRD